MKALFLTQTEPSALSRIREQLDGRIRIDQIDPDDLDRFTGRTDDYDIVVGGRVPLKFLEQATGLRYLVIPYAGVSLLDRNNLAKFPGITVLNSHYNTVPASEHAWGLLLAAAKWIVFFDRKLRQDDWSGRYGEDNSWSLSGKRLLLIGYGEIGRKLATYARAFAMNISAIKRTPGVAPELDFIGTRNDLSSQLAQADMIIISLPGNSNTTDLIGPAEFSAMKDGVVFVNVGRGTVVNEDAFFAAMESGKIGAAGIDTWWQYPESIDTRCCTNPSRHRLERFENLVMSPHRAAHISDRNVAWVKDMVAILKSIAGNKPINIVDRVEWY